MSNPGNYTLNLPTDGGRHATPPEPPVDVRLETAISQLAHDFSLSYDEAAAVRAILAHDQDIATWHIAAEARKPVGVRNTGNV